MLAGQRPLFPLHLNQSYRIEGLLFISLTPLFTIKNQAWNKEYFISEILFNTQPGIAYEVCLKKKTIFL